MDTFPNIKEAIDSWYAWKASPGIVVFLEKDETVTGTLSTYSPTEITVRQGTTFKPVKVSEIRKIELSWDGVDLPEMGELDGTGMDGASLPGATWNHRILRCGDKWIFTELSKESASSYEGERYRARQAGQ